MLTKSELIARFESSIYRGLLTLSPKTIVRLYAKGRLYFMAQLIKETPCPYRPDETLGKTLWNIRFRAPLFNAAGMFKNGEGYQLAAAQGAGAYLAGTTTSNPRVGNSRSGIHLPTIPYSYSKGSSNWLGLPNDGDSCIAQRLSEIKPIDGCPVGVSTMGDPSIPDLDLRLEKMISSLLKYHEVSSVSFIEVNESCPNTEENRPGVDELQKRLAVIKDQFLDKRGRNLPVILKFSSDVDSSNMLAMVRLAIESGFDGINFGNTSTQYVRLRSSIEYRETALFDYFTSTFGGGVGGKPIYELSLHLIKEARKLIDSEKLDREFHLIATGGIFDAFDVHEMLTSGASLTQWYTGYFENFKRCGHHLYSDVFSTLFKMYANKQNETSLNQDSNAGYSNAQ